MGDRTNKIRMKASGRNKIRKNITPISNAQNLSEFQYSHIQFFIRTLASVFCLFGFLLGTLIAPKFAKVTQKWKKDKQRKIKGVRASYRTKLVKCNGDTCMSSNLLHNILNYYSKLDTKLYTGYSVNVTPTIFSVYCFFIYWPCLCGIFFMSWQTPHTTHPHNQQVQKAEETPMKIKRKRKELE